MSMDDFRTTILRVGQRTKYGNKIAMCTVCGEKAEANKDPFGCIMYVHTCTVVNVGGFQMRHIGDNHTQEPMFWWLEKPTRGTKHLNNKGHWESNKPIPSDTEWI